MADPCSGNDYSWATPIPYLAHANTGVIRQHPEDFQVDEIPLFEPAGEGEHLWLKIRKINTNTDWIAGQLAKWLGVKRQDIGYAGLKDRYAITTQWFSVYLPGKKLPALNDQIPPHLLGSVEILEQTRHQKKLRRGTLEGNRFSIVIRNFSGDTASIEEAVGGVRSRGIPNYFGVQRFGHHYKNIERACHWFAGKTHPRYRQPKNRQQRSLYLSAARSLIFNHILAKRVSADNWDRALPGDVFMLNGSHSWFQDNKDDTLDKRLTQFDIHPSGALWGRGRLPSTDTVAELETEIAEQHATLCDGLERHGLKQERRALRVAVQDLQAKWQDPSTVQVQFSLPAGAYATVVVEHLCHVMNESSINP